MVAVPPVHGDDNPFVLSGLTFAVTGLVRKAVGITLPPLGRRYADIQPKPHQRPEKTKLTPRE